MRARLSFVEERPLRLSDKTEHETRKKIMKVSKKLTLVSCATVTLLSGAVNPQIQAQGLLNETGTATLADAFGAASGPEALTVSWSVVENASDIYTYSYTVNNPAADVVLNNSGSPTSQPAAVDAFSVAFDTTVPGALVAASQSGGIFDQNNGATGLLWLMSPVTPGSSSPTLSFQSDSAPGLGDAGALGSTPPGPWSSAPSGQLVPVPSAGPTIVPEPKTTALLGFAALAFIPAGRLAKRHQNGASFCKM